MLFKYLYGVKIMVRNEIQEQRVREYFINATKEMLKGEGFKSISVRTIAERAGYSFGTLYNYFKDIKDLIFICIEEFQKECIEYVEKNCKSAKPGKDRVTSVLNYYIKYFVQYPGIFELFFLENVTDISNKKHSIESICTTLDALYREDWVLICNSGSISPDDAVIKKKELNSMVTGLLLLYINRRYPEKYKDFANNSQELIQHILKDI